MVREIKISIETSAELRALDQLVQKAVGLQRTLTDMNSAMSATARTAANYTAPLDKLFRAMGQVGSAGTKTAQGVSSFGQAVRTTEASVKSLNSWVVKMNSGFVVSDSVARKLRAGHGESVKAMNDWEGAIERSNKALTNLSAAERRVSEIQKQAVVDQGARRKALSEYGTALEVAKASNDQFARSEARMAEAHKQNQAAAAQTRIEYTAAKNVLAELDGSEENYGKALENVTRLQHNMAASFEVLNQSRREMNALTKTSADQQKENNQVVEQAQHGLSTLSRAVQDVNAKQQESIRIQKEATKASEASQKAAMQAVVAREKELAVLRKDIEARSAQAAAAKQTVNAAKIASGLAQDKADEQARAAQMTRLRNDIIERAHLEDTAQQNAQRGVQEAQRVAQTASRLHSEAVRNIQNALMTVSRAAGSLGTSVRSGITSATHTIGTFINTAASLFARLKSALSSAGGWFSGFAASVKGAMGSSTRSMQEFYAAGWSLLMTGQMVGQTGQNVLRRLGSSMTDYMGYEQSLTRTAISASADPKVIQDMLFGIQRGNQGVSPGYQGPSDLTERLPVYQFTSDELAKGLYFYTSALGQTITEDNQAAIADAVTPILQMAAATQTSPETAIKAVLNAAMEFGLDPRDTSQADEIARVAAQMGYLANISTMEVPDIAETFKMVGPMAHILTDQTTPGAGLEETMALSFFASEVGLRGGGPGRGIGQALQTLMDPTAPAIEAASKAFGIGASQEAFHAFFFDAKGQLEGGLPGFFDKLSTLPVESAASVIASIFTTNATRSIVGIEAAIRQHGGISKILADLAGDDPMNWLYGANTKTNDTIIANLQNLKNAWFQVKAEIVASVEGPIKSALESFANLFTRIAMAIQGNPAIGRFLAIVSTMAGIILTVVGGLMTFAGAVLITARAFSMLGAVAHPLFAFLVALPHLLVVLVPILALLAAAAGLLYVAWQSNFLGLRDVINDFRTDFFGAFERRILPMLERVSMFARQMGTALQELFLGIGFGLGPVNNLGAFLSKLLGPLLGPVIFGNLLKLSHALIDVRNNVGAFFTSLSQNAAGVRNVGRTIQGFFEQFFLGRQQMANVLAAQGLGDLFGLENFQVALANGANRFRGFVETVIGYAVMLKRAIFDTRNEIAQLGGGLSFSYSVAGPAQGIAANLSSIFSSDMVSGAVQFGRAVAEGFATGFVSAVMLAVHAIELFTSALARAGDSGRWLATQINQWTGLQLTIEGVGRAIGVAFGSAVGARLVLSLMPLSGLLMAIVGLTGRVALGMLQVAVSVAAGAAQFALMIARIVLLTAVWAAQLVVQGLAIGLTAALGVASAAKTAATLAEAVAAGTATVANVTSASSALVWAAANSVLIATLLPLIGLLATIVAIALAVAAVGLILAAIFAAIGVAMLINTAMTQGLGAAWAGFVDILRGVWAVLSVVGNTLIAVVSAIGGFIGAVLGAIGVGNQFYAIGIAIGVALSLLLFPLIAATVAALAFAAALLAVAVAAILPYIPIIALIAAIYIVADAIAKWAGFDSIFDAIATGISKLGDLVGYLKDKWDSATDAVYKYFGTQETGRRDAEIARLEVDRDVSVNEYVKTKPDVTTAYSTYEVQMIRDEGRAPTSDEQDRFMMGYGAQVRQQGYDQWVANNGGYTYMTGAVGGPNQPQATMRLDPIQQLRYESAHRQKDIQVVAEDDAEAYQQGWMQKVFSGLAGNEVVGSFFEMLGIDPNNPQFADIDIMKALGMPEFDNVMAQMDSDLMSGMPTWMQDYTKDLQAYDAYLKDVAMMGIDETRQLYDAMNIPIPQPPNIKDYFDQVESDIAEGAAAVEEQIAAFAANFSTALGKLDLGAAMNVAFGEGFGTFSPAGALVQIGEQVMTNIGDAGPWLDMTELIADAAIVGELDGNVLGENLHEALRPALELTAQQTGVSFEDMMKDVPKYIHDEAYIPLVVTELAEGLSHIPRELGTKLDTLGAGEYTEHGLKWAELTEYAIGQAMAGHDWNLADYISSSWGLSIDEANAYLAANGLDPDLISSEMFGGVEQAIASQGGQVSIIAAEAWAKLTEAQRAGQDMSIEISKKAFEDMDVVTKIGLSNMGYSFIVGGAEVANISGTTAGEIANSFGESFRNGFSTVSTYVDEETGQLMVVLDDLEGRRIVIPEPEYQAYVEAMRVMRAETELFQGSWTTFYEQLALQSKIDPWGHNQPPLDKDMVRKMFEAEQASNMGDTPSEYMSSTGALPGFPTNGDVATAAVAAATTWTTTVASNVADSTEVQTAITTAISEPFVAMDMAPFTTAGTNAAQAFGTAFRNGITSALSSAGTGVGSATSGAGGAALGGAAAGGIGGSGPFDQFFVGYAQSAAIAFGTELRTQLAIQLSTITELRQGSGEGGQVAGGGPFDAMFEGYAITAVNAFITKLGEELTRMLAPNEMIDKGMAEAGAVGPFDAMFTSYATAAATAFDTELRAQLTANMATIGGVQASGEGGQAQGGGPFDAMFSGYATSAANKFVTQLGIDLSTMLAPNSMIDLGMAEAGADGPFNAMFRGYATSAANAFMLQLGTGLGIQLTTEGVANLVTAEEGADGPFNAVFEGYGTSAANAFGTALSAGISALMSALGGGGAVDISAVGGFAALSGGGGGPFDATFAGYGSGASATFGNNLNANLTAVIEDATSRIKTEFVDPIWMANLSANPILAIIGIAIAALAAMLYARTYTATLAINDQASSVISSVSNGLSSLNGRVATSTIKIVTETSTVARATGGRVSEALTLVGEHGPELVALPFGSYVHTASKTSALSNRLSSNGLLGASSLGSIERSMARATDNNVGNRNDGGVHVQGELVMQKVGDVYGPTVTFGDIHIHNDVDAAKFFADFDRRLGTKGELQRRGMGAGTDPNRNI